MPQGSDRQGGYLRRAKGARDIESKPDNGRGCTKNFC